MFSARIKCYFYTKRILGSLQYRSVETAAIGDDLIKLPDKKIVRRLPLAFTRHDNRKIRAQAACVSIEERRRIRQGMTTVQQLLN